MDELRNDNEMLDDNGQPIRHDQHESTSDSVSEDEATTTASTDGFGERIGTDDTAPATDAFEDDDDDMSAIDDEDPGLHDSDDATSEDSKPVF